jgi:hypothetical protein
VLVGDPAERRSAVRTIEAAFTCGGDFLFHGSSIAQQALPEDGGKLPDYLETRVKRSPLKLTQIAPALLGRPSYVNHSELRAQLNGQRR